MSLGETSNLSIFLAKLRKRLNSDPEFKSAAEDWVGDLVYTLLPDPNFPWILRILFSIENGEIKATKVIDPESDVKPRLEFKMMYSTFMMIARGNMDISTSAVLKGTIKLYGSKLEALKKMKMFNIIVKHLREILREWRGKTAILLRRAEFKAPHIIMGKDVREIISGLKAKKALIVTDKVMVQLGIVDEVKRLLSKNNVIVEVFDGVEPEPPIELVKKAVKIANRFKPNVIIGIGGGSCMDTAKAVFALYERPDIPLERVDPSWELGLRKKARLILIPTTSGTGSEVTWASVVTIMKDGVREKVGIGNRELIPDYAIVDPYFIYNLPKKLVSSTGLDALTHALEGIISPWRNELVYAVGLRAIKLLLRYLPKSYKENDKLAREKVHYAATLAGLAFGNSQATLCHGLGHAFGATFRIPHGWAVSVFIPYVIDYYRDDAKNVLEEIAEEIGIMDGDKVEQLRKEMIELIKAVDGYTKLSEFEISEDDFMAKIDTLVELSKDDSCTYSGPKIPSDDEIRKLYEYAYYGKRVDF